MFNISVNRIIDKPIQVVFDALSDHANYQTFKGIDKSSLIKEGSEDKNGLGAVREIVAGNSTLHEEIVTYEPPTKLGYKITYSKPLPYDHQVGEITLEEKDGQTHVTWCSKGHITIPILGTWYFDKQIDKFGSRAFGSILKTIASR
ncbi:SRPBCC family protein [Glaciecola sp. KUL10]|uniref:SRPBCC family protein n=1 Tax=Glaciecola sp. (strain KUL10) TaxID=2161813 RepID=UPI000D788328|nr:SRPBCC family protein [Glaciecola sp. KUL10]GBL04309.1 hypothetical protein KUL10_16150 [Glaciecola sp. KUL10]